MEGNNQMRPRLDRRLRAIAAMVEGTGLRLADIGADHGYLVTWLALEGKLEKGYACDINEQPLERSRATIRRFGVQSLVETRLTDGLHGLSPELVDRVVIAGMGGDLIARILEAAGWEQQKHIQYLLQPNTKADHLRRWLWEHGFQVAAERVAEEGRFVYPILHVLPGKADIPPEKLAVYCALGKIGSHEGPLTPEERKYLERRIGAAELRLNGLLTARVQNREAELMELEAVIAAAEQLLRKETKQ